MKQRYACLAISLFAASLSTAAEAGTSPVDTTISAPVAIGTVIDTQSVALTLAPFAASDPVVQTALQSLESTTPGSFEALNAVNSLAGAVAVSLGSGEASLPVLTTAQLTQAISIVDGLIATLQAEGASVEGLQALRAALDGQRALSPPP